MEIRTGAVFNQFFLGGFIIASSLFGFFLLYTTTLRWKKEKKGSDSMDIGTETDHDMKSSENCYYRPEIVGSTDVIVVGARVADSALAYSLAKDGRRVHAIERDLTEHDSRIIGELFQPGGHLKLIELGFEEKLISYKKDMSSSSGFHDCEKGRGRENLSKPSKDSTSSKDSPKQDILTTPLTPAPTKKVEIVYNKDERFRVLFLQDIDMQWINDPFYVASRYFEENQFFPYEGLSSNMKKLRIFYEAILLETKSVSITHVKSDLENHHPHYIYSKVFIHKVISFAEWGLNPNKKSSLQGFPNMDFNYWDYIQAWKKAFYYQNPQREHAWLFMFKDFSLKIGTPNWFLKWWMCFGPEQDYLPSDLKYLFLEFESFQPHLKALNFPKGRGLFYFNAQFSIPWIWSWTFEISSDPMYENLYTLFRRHQYKWWAKLDILKVSAEVFEIIKGFRKLKEKEEIKEASSFSLLKIPTRSPLKELKSSLLIKYPGISKEELKFKILELLTEAENSDSETIKE